MEDAKSFKTTDCDGIPYETHLQVGGKYMVTTNIDVSDGLFNGATGTLCHIEFGKNRIGESIPTIAWMEFDRRHIGSEMKKKHTHLYHRDFIMDAWIPIQRITRTLTKSRHRMYDGLELTRTQIPIIAANGMTIAKSQGATMKHVVVCTNSRRKLTRENLYVACSRATSLSGLYIYGKFAPPEKPPQDDYVTIEMQTLKEHPVTMSLRFFADVKSRFKLYYHNIQSYNKYKLDLQADPHIMSSHYIALVEPHITAGQNVELDGYCTEIRVDASNGSNSRGCLVLSKRHIGMLAKAYT